MFAFNRRGLLLLKVIFDLYFFYNFPSGRFQLDRVIDEVFYNLKLLHQHLIIIILV